MHKRKARKVAVALQYNSDNKDTPFVVAKGKGIVADNIIEKGIEEGVQVIEDKTLADSLAQLEITQEIPEELYTVVAEILSFIYSLDKERK